MRLSVDSTIDKLRRVITSPSIACCQDLAVVVPLLVPIVEPTHRRIPPVDDANARLGIEVGATPISTHDDGRSLRVQATEIRRPQIDVALALFLASLVGEALQTLHLLEQRGNVFETRRG